MALLLRMSPDFTLAWVAGGGAARGFSGEGVGSLLVRTFTAPSTVIDKRIMLDDLVSGSLARGGGASCSNPAPLGVGVRSPIISS